MPLSVTNIGSNTGVAVNTVAVTVPAGGVPVGALIVVCVSDNSVSGTGGLNAVADTGGNVYTSAVQANNNNAAANGCGIMYTANVTKALVNTNTITYTLGTATSSAAVAAFYIKGAPTLIEAKNSATGSSTTPSVTSGTPSVAGDLFIGMVSATTLVSSFTQDSTNAAWASPPGQVSIAAPPLGGGNVVNAGAGTRTYAPTFGTTDTWAALIMGVQGTVSGWEVRPPEVQTFPTTKQRYTATKGKSGFAVFPEWKNLGWEPNLPTPLIRPPVTNQRAGAILRGDDGIQGRKINFFRSGWEPNLPQPLKQPPVVNQKAAAVLKGDEGIQARKINFFPSGWEIQPPPPPHIFVEKRGAILKGDDGTEGKFINFFPSGWEIQPWQPPFFPTTNLKTAALSHPEEGIEAKFIPPSINPDGWEIQAFQPSFFPTTKQKYSALSHPEEGIEAPKVNFFPTGWEFQASHLLAKYLPNTRSVPNLGDDGTQTPYINWKNFGWEIQSVQPPFYPKTNQKIAALSQWEDGIEAKYVFISSANWFEIQPTIPKISYKSGAWSQKEDGIEFPFIRFFPGGWEIQAVQPPIFPSVKQRYLGTKGKSEFGIYSLWQNFGWEIQSVQPPTYPTIQQKTGALSHPEEGIEAKYVFVSPTVNWSFDIQQSPLKINYRSGAWSQKEDGIEASYINWKNFGWEIQPVQPPHRQPEIKASSFLRGDDGTEFPFIKFLPYSWEIQPPPPPHTPRPEKVGSILKGDDGTQAIFVNWKNTGWEIQPFQPPHLFIERRGTVLRGNDGIEGTYYNWVNQGWEIQSWQPPSFLKTNQKTGALSHPEEGIEATYIFVPSTPVNWGWELLPPHLRPQTSNRYFGIEGNSEFASFTFQPYGWEIQSFQPPNFLKTNQKIGALSHPEDGIEAQFIFVPTASIVFGYNVQQTISKINYRSGAWSQKTEGIEATLINFYPSGWEIQPPTPPHTFVEKRGLILRGDDGTEGQFIRFFPYGWEIAPYQPPFFPTTKQRYGALSHPEEGIEGKYIFISRNVDLNPIGWVIQPYQPPHPRPERSGAWMFGELGIEAPFKFVAPTIKNFEFLIKWRRRGRR